MICPDCQSTNINKNGLKRGKQNHICSDCRRQFIDVYSERGYPQEVKKQCLHLYLEGNGFRRIERLTGVLIIQLLIGLKKRETAYQPNQIIAKFPKLLR